MISIEVPDSSDHWQPLIDEFVLSHGALSFRPDYGPAFAVWLKEIIRDEYAVVYVAREATEVIGLAVGTIEKNAPLLLPARIGYVPVLVTSPRHRGKGTGKRLWETLRDWFLSRGIKEIKLSTAIDNGGARAFWQACGCEVFFERRRIRLS